MKNCIVPGCTGQVHNGHHCENGHLQFRAHPDTPAGEERVTRRDAFWFAMLVVLFLLSSALGGCATMEPCAQYSGDDYKTCRAAYDGAKAADRRRSSSSSFMCRDALLRGDRGGAGVFCR